MWGTPLRYLSLGFAFNLGMSRTPSPTTLTIKVRFVRGHNSLCFYEIVSVNQAVYRFIFSEAYPAILRSALCILHSSVVPAFRNEIVAVDLKNIIVGHTCYVVTGSSFSALLPGYGYVFIGKLIGI